MPGEVIRERINVRTVAYDDKQDKLSDIGDHIDFASVMVNKYNWESETLKNAFRTKLRRIKMKHRDKLFNLTVVGEFGTGKSTFINAMLRRDDFLVSSALQGTTVAATIIEGGENFSVRLEYKNGKKYRKNYENAEEVREAIIDFTTDPKIAKDLSNVKINVPDTPLTSGFRIIDTPGTNSNERWHEDVTIRTIQEMTDVAVLIVDANKPLSETFCDFVKTNLADMLPKCAFIITRLDMIRKREREGVIAYLKAKISKEFRLNNPMVLPYAALDILDDVAGDECTELAKLSYSSEVTLLNYMTELKAKTQTKNLISLIDGLYASLSNNLKNLYEGYKGELELLRKSESADIITFGRSQLKERLRCFKEDSGVVRAKWANYFERMTREATVRIISRIDELDSVDKINNFLGNELEKACLTEANVMDENAQKKIADLYRTFNTELDVFAKEFKNIFDYLEIYDVKIKVPEVELKKTTDGGNKKFASANSFIKKEKSKENGLMLGGAATGVAIGTAIAPGVGTIIGALVGLFGGAMVSPSIDKVRVEVKSELRTALKAYFNEVVGTLTKNLDEHIVLLTNRMELEIKRRISKNVEIVNNRIMEESQKISMVSGTINIMNNDMKEIGSRKNSLQTLNYNLNR